MIVEEINLFRDFSPVIALIIIMVIGGKWILQKAFEQVEIARKDFTNYVQTTEKEHITAMYKISENLSALTIGLENHIKMKNEFIESINDQRNIINDQRRTINELFEMLKNQIKTNKQRYHSTNAQQN